MTSWLFLLVELNKTAPVSSTPDEPRHDTYRADRCKSMHPMRAAQSPAVAWQSNVHSRSVVGQAGRSRLGRMHSGIIPHPE